LENSKKIPHNGGGYLRVNEFGADDVIGVGQQIIVPRK